MTHPQNDLTPQASVPQPSPQPVKSSKALATDDLPSIALATEALAPSAIPGSQFATLNSLLSAPQPSAESPLPALQFSAAPLQPLPDRPPGKPRNGKIAHLPKLERDLVNRMLANNLPHQKIVMALDECGFHVTERNVSNWKTRGGYNEWRVAQEGALELRSFQDNLTEFLRRHDAAELPEVGLQSAATSLSAILLRPDLMRQLIADPQKYSSLIELQCRLAREIQALQKHRDDAAKSLGRTFNPEKLKRLNEQDVESVREVMSSKIGKSIREPNVPHRNFIPKELEPVEPDPEPLDLADLKRLRATFASHRSPGDSTPQAPR
jgi:hypothetical protein